MDLPWRGASGVVTVAGSGVVCVAECRTDENDGMDTDAEEGMTDWQPIETAPMNGTEFLAFRKGEIAVAYRIPRDDCEMWKFGRSSASIEACPEFKPTHWMPLPEAPK